MEYTMIIIEYLATDRLTFEEIAPSEDIARMKARRTSKVKRLGVTSFRFVDGKGREVFRKKVDK